MQFYKTEHKYDSKGVGIVFATGLGEHFRWYSRDGRTWTGCCGKESLDGFISKGYTPCTKEEAEKLLGYKIEITAPPDITKLLYEAAKALSNSCYWTGGVSNMPEQHFSDVQREELVKILREYEAATGIK